MKQTIIHDRTAVPEKIRGQFRNSIEYARDREQNLIRHKKYKPTGNKHKSIYSLAMESNLIINDLDFNPPKMVQSVHHREQGDEDRAIHRQRRSRENSSVTLSKDIKLQRYSQQERPSQKRIDHPSDDFDYQKNNKEKISLLKRIIEHYNIKTFESNYYSNLMNNLGIKVSGGTEVRSRFANLKTNSIKFQKQQARAIRHQRSLKVKHNSNFNTFDCDEIFNSNLIKVEAQGINRMIKQESEDKSFTKRDPLQKQKVKTTKNLRKTNYSIFKNSKKQIFRNENITSLKYHDNGQNCVNIKINKYKQFLYMINFSHNIHREFDIQKYQNTFKIYIGNGNNSNLIRGIIKRRFWFQITKNKEQANFIWLQLKDQDVFVRQIQKNQEKIKNIGEQKLMKACFQKWYQTNFKLQSQDKINKQTASTVGLQQLQDLSNLDCKLQNVNQQPLKNETKQIRIQKINKNIQLFNPFYRILTNQQANSYMEIMNEITSKKKYKFNDRIKYTKKFRYASQQQSTFEVIQNHLPFNGLLGNKKAMFTVMKEYYTLLKRNVFQIVPLTFHIKKGLADEQFRNFMSKYNQNKNSKRPNYWIMKPGQFSNRGQGITCSCKAEQIRARINGLRKAGKGKTLILQQYLSNPLLYNGRKFDIRTYMLVSVNNGKLRAYWYQDGYIRTSSYAWKLEDTEDSYIHLTNDAIQKYSSGYGKYEPANKLTYSELQRYLDTLPKNSNTKYNFLAQVYPRLRQIAADAVRASFKFLQPERKCSNFEIFGFDFMIDSNFKPWLIQINTNPCLEVNCLVLERIIPSLIENAFRIALDPLFPPPLNYSSTYKYNIPENAFHYNRFELIFDQDRDGPALNKLYANSHLMQNIDDYEQDKQIYQEQGEQIHIEQN